MKREYTWWEKDGEKDYHIFVWCPCGGQMFDKANIPSQYGYGSSIIQCCKCKDIMGIHESFALTRSTKESLEKERFVCTSSTSDTVRI